MLTTSADHENALIELTRVAATKVNLVPPTKAMEEDGPTGIGFLDAFSGPTSMRPKEVIGRLSRACVRLQPPVRLVVTPEADANARPTMFLDPATLVRHMSSLMARRQPQGN